MVTSTFLSLHWHPSPLPAPSQPSTALGVAKCQIVYSGMITILFAFCSFVLSKQIIFGTLEQAVISERCHYHMDSSLRTRRSHVSSRLCSEASALNTSLAHLPHQGRLPLTVKPPPGAKVTCIRPLIPGSTLFIPKKNILQTGAQGLPYIRIKELSVS